jgi:hypothetical protein
MVERSAVVASVSPVDRVQVLCRANTHEALRDDSLVTSQSRRYGFESGDFLRRNIRQIASLYAGSLVGVTIACRGVVLGARA